MEYLEDYEVLTKKLFKNLKEQQRCFVISQLIEAINMLHKNNYVHGDIRMPNIMLKTQNGIELKMIDFEFAGKEGAVYYPNLNGKIFWGPVDEKKNNEDKSYYSFKKITIENDLFMLGRMLEELLETKVIINSLTNFDPASIENIYKISDLTSQLQKIILLD